MAATIPYLFFPTSPPTSPAPAMTVLRRLPQVRLFSPLAAALRQDTSLWTPAPLSSLSPASSDSSLFHLSLDLSDSADLASSYSHPGQYLQLRLPAPGSKPAFLAIASPPSPDPHFEFLVKPVPGSTAEALCGLREGDVVEVSAVMGKGFALDAISPPEDFGTVLVFATGSGISPIRALIESGFGAEKRSDVRLFYGARNLHRMAYQDRFKDWESSGVSIIQVLSQPDGKWDGEHGYVQAAFARAKNIDSPSNTGAVLCGHRQMAEEVTTLLTEDGVSADKILMNF